MTFIAAGLNQTSYPTEVMSKSLIKNLDNNTVMPKLVNGDVSSDLAQFGDTVKLALPGNITVGNYTGADLTFNDITLTTNTLVLNQVKQATFQIDKIDLANSKLAIKEIFMGRLNVAANLTVDSHLLSVGAAGVDPANIDGTATSPILFTKNNVVEKIRQAKLELAADNVPTNNLAFVTTPEVASYLVEIMGERETAKGDEILATGRVGKILDVEIYETTNLTASSGVFQHMLFNKDLFIHHVMRIPPNQIDIIPMFEKNFKMGVKALFYYGSKVFHPTAGFVFNSSN